MLVSLTALNTPEWTRTCLLLKAGGSLETKLHTSSSSFSHADLSSCGRVLLQKLLICQITTATFFFTAVHISQLFSVNLSLVCSSFSNIFNCSVFLFASMFPAFDCSDITSPWISVYVCHSCVQLVQHAVCSTEQTWAELSTLGTRWPKLGLIINLLFALFPASDGAVWLKQHSCDFCLMGRKSALVRSRHPARGPNRPAFIIWQLSNILD